MIELKDALNIYNILIDRFGGSKGIRGQGSLESAIYRPLATFDNQDFCPDPLDKAAAILESILINHPLWTAIKEQPMFSCDSFFQTTALT